jgi:hypothetical protein
MWPGGLRLVTASKPWRPRTFFASSDIGPIPWSDSLRTTSLGFVPSHVRESGGKKLLDVPW